MDVENKDLITGGLPLNSEDFVKPEEVKQNKSKLLAALGNINRLHNAQQESIRKAEEQEAEATKLEDSKVELEDYILEKDIEHGEDELMFKNDNVVSTTESLSPTDAEMEQMNVAENNAEPEVMENPNTAEETPVYAVDEKSKKGKKSKAGKKERVRLCSDEEVKAGKGVAWLSYILFFIPLLINGKNNFVRHHANEGFEVLLIDILGAGLICVGHFLQSNNSLITLALLVASVLGVVLLILTTLTKIVLIIMALSGKEGRSPWFWNIKFIKLKK